jgi:sec-independent protein translocase protein TatA
MFGLSGEHLILIAIILLIFGPKRLPELGNTLGKAIRNFKDSVSGVEEAKFRKIAEEEKKSRGPDLEVAAEIKNDVKAEPQKPSGTDGGSSSS